jgi:hypothetical protein
VALALSSAGAWDNNTIVPGAVQQGMAGLAGCLPAGGHKLYGVTFHGRL